MNVRTYGKIFVFETSATRVGTRRIGVSVGIGAFVGGGVGVGPPVGGGVAVGVCIIAPATAESSLEELPGAHPFPALTTK